MSDEEIKTEPESVFTDAQLAKLTELITGAVSKSLNPAISAHLKRYSASVDEKLASLAKPAEPTPTPGEAAKPNAEMQALMKKLEDLERQNKEKDEKAAEAERRRIAIELQTKTAEILRANKIGDQYLDAALAVLMDRHKRIELDEAGNAIYKATDKYGNVTSVPLAQGLTDWAKSDEGKAFIPAVPVKGMTPPNGAAPTQLGDRGVSLAELGTALLGGRVG